MNTIEQAWEVSKRLHLGVSIANDRNIDKDFTVIAKAAGNTIDALIAEINALKVQQPVAWVRFSDGEVDYDSDAVISNVEGDCMDEYIEWRPVYAAPPQAQLAPKQQTLKADGIVGWRWVATCGSGTYQLRDDEPLRGYSYKAPVYESLPVQAQERKPLTDDQIIAIAEDHLVLIDNGEFAFARAIEAAHGIGEQG